MASLQWLPSRQHGRMNFCGVPPALYRHCDSNMLVIDRAESLRAAERQLQAVQLASDVAALGDLLADDLLFTGPDGSLSSKEPSCS